VNQGDPEHMALSSEKNDNKTTKPK